MARFGGWLNDLRPGWQILIALAVYLAAGLALLGPGVLPHMGSTYAGSSPDDPDLFMWMLAWWPHVVGHGVNPLFTHAVYAPTGFNLAWTTVVPGPGLLLAPVTSAFGPIASYNVLFLLSAPLAAWTAFALCRHVTRAFLPSIAGGFVFGFSSYVFAHLIGHPNLTLVFLIPVCVLLVVRCFDGSMRPRWVVPLLSLALIGQFAISTEVLATMTLVGGVVLVVAAVAVQRGERRRLVRAVGWVGLAYAVTAAVAVPYLIAMLAHPQPIKSYHTTQASADLLNLVVPTPLDRFGGQSFGSITRTFTGSLAGNDAYLGVVLVVIAVHFAVTNWRSVAGKILTSAWVIAVVLSLGPALKIEGNGTIPMPWRVFAGLPLLGRVLAGRLIVYAFLPLAVIVAIWLTQARGPRSGAVRWSMAVVAVAMMVPNVGLAYPSIRPNVPAFFVGDGVRRSLTPGQVVMIAGVGKGNPMLWQAESGMAFDMPQGYLGLTPPDFTDSGVSRALQRPQPPRIGPEKLREFLNSHGVAAVIVPAGAGSDWDRLFAGWATPPVTVGDVRLYRRRPPAR